MQLEYLDYTADSIRRFENDITHGFEIEAVDFDRSSLKDNEEFKSLGSFNKKEITLVNSDGRAVNSWPKSEYLIGGEVNTHPMKGKMQTAKQVRMIFDLLKENGAIVNYRCNIQYHIGIEKFMDSLSEDDQLRALKLILKHTTEESEEYLNMTMGDTNRVKLPEYPSPFWLHHHEDRMPDFKYRKAMQSTSIEEFRNSFFLLPSGKSHFSAIFRAYVNIHSYFKYSTIEFRNFYATLDPAHIMPIISFSNYVIKRALFGIEFNLHEKFNINNFPKRTKFDIELEKSFQKTRVKK